MTAEADPTKPARQMWGGRFAAAPSAAMTALNNSLPVDHRLWPEDIRASKAWVHALRGAGVLSDEEEHSLHRGLDQVGERLAKGKAASESDEDIHSLVERMLFEEVGDVAGKLHTGRSRNDQVATDLRLWCLGAIDMIDGEVRALIEVLHARACEGLDVLLPGYTHGQQAQPVRWGYVVLSHAWPLVRDRERLQDIKQRVSQMPLGSGAIAGSGVEVDRVLLKESLGFRDLCNNALDATGDRDFVADVLFSVNMIAVHLSRLGGELVTYSSSEYGFIRLSDEFSTGSSLLPQKRNPDVFELARAKAARTLGDLVTVLSTLRALPAGYSKDLQEDKPALFSAVDTILVTLPALRGAVATLKVVPDRMRAALQDTLMATDVADALVKLGVPFRHAHHLVGQLVRRAEELGQSIRKVDPSEAKKIHDDLPRVIENLGSFEDSTNRRKTVGGSSLASVQEQLTLLESHLTEFVLPDAF